MTQPEAKSKPKPPFEPKEYWGIYAWGQLMGSNASYVREQQARAAAQLQPLDVIYYDREGRRWFTVSSIKGTATLEFIQRYRPIG